MLAGDNAGFPNGRRLGDDVADIELRVIGGFLLPADQGGKKLPLGDGVDQNDKPFLSSFPYVAPPTAGLRLGDQAHRAGARPHAGAAVARMPIGARALAGAPSGFAERSTHEMALRRINLMGLAAVAATFLAALAVFGLMSRSHAPGLHGSASDPTPGDVRSTDARIASLQTEIRNHPGDTGSYALLADAYLQKVRETGDAGFYTRAAGVLAVARRRDPRDSAVATGLGTLALARHDFRGGLRFGLTAHALAPEVVRPLGVIVDAQVELGRYGDAGARCSGWSTRSPTWPPTRACRTSASCTATWAARWRRCSLAVDAGGDAPENVAYVQTLLGDLEFQRGRLSAAGRRVPARAVQLPGVRARAGRPREGGRGARAAGPSRSRACGTSWRDCRCPQYVIALGEDELAAGHRAAAARDLALVGAERRLLAANGREHRHRDRAVRGRPRLARRARWRWRGARAPRRPACARPTRWAGRSRRAAGRAPGLACARRALRLGSRDPLFLYHAGMAAAGGRRARAGACSWRRALSLNPRFSPLYAPRARRALRALP